MEANGERPCESGVQGLTELLGGVSGTGGVGKENIVGDGLPGGVSRASGDELLEE